MSGAIIVQPDGRLAVWSSVVDALVLWDATDAEVTAHFVKDAVDRELRAASWAISRARQGLGPRRSPSWEDAVAETVRHFGDDPDTRRRFGGGS